MQGFITKYNSEKGYGFINGEDGIDYFFHISSMKNFVDDKLIEERLKVSFDGDEGERGKKANNVVLHLDYRTEHLYFRNNNKQKKVEFRGGKEEKVISSKFNEILKITFSNDSSFKNSFYSYNFLQPSETYRASFNMFNEVLMLFSNFNYYDDRAMDYVDKLFMDYSNRLDPVVIILISKDKNIKEIIKRNNVSNHESRIVVPFTYDEILNRNFEERIFQSRLREFFYQRDLFAMESPLNSDSYFFGRSNIVHNFFDKYSIGEQTGLFGLRKTGKTSVLFALRRLVNARKGISIFTDCQNPSVYNLRWYELLEYLIGVIIKEVKEKLDIEIELNNKEKYDEKNAGNNFLNSLIEINKKINKRVLLIFDEVEHITFDISRNDYWKSGDDYLSFWQTLRSIIQTNQNLCAFVIAGVNPRIIEEVSIKGYDNPIFNNITPTYLNLFKYDDVKTMVSEIGSYMGLKFEESMYHKLDNDYGGHPFLIRNVCSMMNSYFKERPYTITSRDYDDYKEVINKQLIPYIKSILIVLESWYPTEFSILKDIALENKDEYTIKINQDESIINHLIGYGIVIRSTNGNYYIEIEAIKNYMNNNFKNEMMPTERNSMRELISSRRDSIERKLRVLVKQTLIIKYGLKSVEKVIEKYSKENIETIKERRKDKDLFSGLYFSEIKNLIFGEYKDFSNIITIDKALFIAAMNKINEYRFVDAHAGDISKEEYQELHIYFSQIEKVLEVF